MYPLVYSLINAEIKKTKVVFKYLQTLKEKLITSMNWRFSKWTFFKLIHFWIFRYKLLQFWSKSKRAAFKKQAKLYIIELYKQHFKPAMTILPLKNRISREITDTNKIHARFFISKFSRKYRNFAIS
jgi:hypothetical protein